MDLNGKELEKILQSSNYGVFCQIDGETQFLTPSSGSLRINRSFQKLTEDSFLLQLSFENKSTKPLKVFSGVVADCYLPAGSFLEEVLNNSWSQSDETRFHRSSKPTYKNVIFLKTDQNSFSFRDEYGHLPGSIVSEWFTILRFKGGDCMVGAVTTADQFCTVFVRDEKDNTRVRVTCQFDGLILSPGDTFRSEKVAVVWGRRDEATKTFSDLVAKNMGIEKVKAPVRGLCCSYYWRGNDVNENIVEKELEVLKSLDKPLVDYVQIDAGYCPHFGDWLDYNQKFPGGLGRIARKISEAGFIPGIWISPFIANPTSHLFKEHPNWFLKDDKGDFFESTFLSPLHKMARNFNFRVLDPTNEEFRKYLVGLLEQFLQMGFKLFKIDFMYPVCLSTNYSKPMTRVRALRSGAELIRKTVGEDVHLLGGISVISPLVGVVDSIRLGVDSLMPFICKIPLLRNIVNNYMLKCNLRSTEIYSKFNNKLWVNDPDCVMLREKTGIKKSLTAFHMKFTLENKMSRWLGDSLASLNSEQLKEAIEFMSYRED